MDDIKNNYTDENSDSSDSGENETNTLSSNVDGWKNQGELDSDEDNFKKPKTKKKQISAPTGSDDDSSDEEFTSEIEDSLQNQNRNKLNDNNSQAKPKKERPPKQRYTRPVEAPPPEVIRTDLCVECEDTPAKVRCEQCGDIYCELCFKSQHRKGNRNHHTYEKLSGSEPPKDPMDLSSSQNSISSNNNSIVTTPTTSKGVYQEIFSSKVDNTEFIAWLTERCKFIPVRLSTKERRLLKLVESALNVSEYTDHVDILSWKRDKESRITDELKDICSTMLGLIVTADFKSGQNMVNEKTYKDNAEFFQKLFEIARRYKITNPEKMRSDYGKLLYLLQDSVYTQIQQILGFQLVKPIITVYDVLLSKDSISILEDPNIMIATSEVTDDGTKSRDEIATAVKQKEMAIDFIAKKHGKDELPADDIKMLLYSIGDNNSFLTYNRDTVDSMIQYLKKYFTPNKAEKGYSLEISYGYNGARLSHSHDRQYYYVLQSLHLWRAIMHDMFRLWLIAEQDLLDSENYYRLRDTGQGLNRVQDAPLTGKAISRILGKTQASAGGWVGSSVVHLGDHNVPNAFMFIDKYTQVPRILGPTVKCIDRIDQISEDPGIRDYIEDTFGSLEDCKKQIYVIFSNMDLTAPEPTTFSMPGHALTVV